MQHVLKFHVDAVDLSAGAFAQHIQTRQIGLAQIAPRRGRAQGDIRDRVNLCRLGRQIRIGDGSTIRQDHRAILRPQIPTRHTNATGRRLFQGFARRRPRQTHPVKPIRHRGRPTCHLDRQQFCRDRHEIAQGFGHKSFLIGWDWHAFAQHRGVVIGLPRHPRGDHRGGRVDVQLLGDQIGLDGIGPLPLVRTRRDQGDAIGVDLHKGRDRRLTVL